MRLLSHKYNTYEELKHFLEKNDILDSKSLFIQIFSSHIDAKPLQIVIEELQGILPDASFIATSTAGIISDGCIVDHGITISFSIFEASLVKSKGTGCL